MKELIKKLIEAGRKDALNSLDELKEAAKQLGCTEQEIEKALEDLDGFPLDEDALEDITGGTGFYTAVNNQTFENGVNNGRMKPAKPDNTGIHDNNTFNYNRLAPVFFNVSPGE